MEDLKIENINNLLPKIISLFILKKLLYYLL